MRALAFADRGGVAISARRGEDATGRYPELAAIGEALAGHEAILDGEVVAFDERGEPSFGRLQRRMGLTDAGRIRRRAAETPVTYVAFDVLWLDGRSLLAEPYELRRELLAGLAFDGPCWQAPAHRVGGGDELLGAVRDRGLEGVVAKRLGSAYRPGRRSADWVKVQNRRRQEIVVGGFMPGEGARRRGVGSLLVGYWDSTPAEAASLDRPQRLVYAGGVGTGFTDATLDLLGRVLEPLRRPTSPFEAGWDPEVKYAARIRERGPLAWVEPVVVCEVEFARWTHEDTLRAAVFRGLRDDKDAREVVRES
ncbi:MAG: DNA ligase [Solirubrobacterales bacterium]|nr:DNA ligase [Solirubrobacterales bacterium]